TPLPIPNREVKPASADGTRDASPRESRTPPFFFIEVPGTTVPGTSLLRTAGSDTRAERAPAWFARQELRPRASRASPGRGPAAAPRARRPADASRTATPAARRRTGSTCRAAPSP